ncbi:hypothetical protein OHS70_24115 [Streptomyces sp. NBC_00390]|uniref:hypothetical protein n=1 Tax=Streptomyces sp. NBC_00390 TaxID=2975736 RepID=UPI002E21ECEC
MTDRPSTAWRAEASGDASAAELYTPALLDATDTALEAYEAEIRALRPASDAQLLAAVERVVLALNGIDEEHGAYCTIEREELCEYIDGVLTGHGVDVAALAARNGKDADDIAGEWRDR